MRCVTSKDYREVSRFEDRERLSDKDIVSRGSRSRSLASTQSRMETYRVPRDHARSRRRRW